MPIFLNLPQNVQRSYALFKKKEIDFNWNDNSTFFSVKILDKYREVCHPVLLNSFLGRGEDYLSSPSIDTSHRPYSRCDVGHICVPHTSHPGNYFLQKKVQTPHQMLNNLLSKMRMLPLQSQAPPMPCPLPSTRVQTALRKNNHLLILNESFRGFNHQSLNLSSQIQTSLDLAPVFYWLNFKNFWPDIESFSFYYNEKKIWFGSDFFYQINI